MDLRSNLLFLLLLPFACLSQDIPIETWRTHFSYNQIERIVSGPASIIAAAENGVFYLNKNDGSLNLLTKLDGLSDVGSSAMAYDESSGALVLGYPSGLVDIFRNAEAINVTEIYESQLVGNKAIRDVETRNNKIYAANGFGIVVININTGEIIENYQSIGENATDVSAYQLTSTPDYLIAATNQGMLAGLLSQNLLDFNNWKTLASATDSYSDLTVQSPNEVLAIVNDTSVVSFDIESGDKTLLFSSDLSVKDLEIVDESIFLLMNNSRYELVSGSLTNAQHYDYEINRLHWDNGWWLASETQGLVDPMGQPLLPNGPFSDDLTHIRFTNDMILGFYGPNVQSYTGQKDSLGYVLFDNQSWQTETPNGFFNITDGQYFNGNLYLASAGYGLLNATTNSKLNIPVSSTSGEVVIPAIKASNSLHITCFDHQSPLVLMNPDESMTTYDEGYTATRYPTGLDISRGETLWMTRASFDGGGIINLELSDDNYRLLTTADELSSNSVNAVTISLTDESWVGTQSGLVSFSDATYIFDDQNGIPAIFDADQLFNGQAVTALTIDGGNRLWVGTSDDGVWVFDSNLSTLVYRFTERNSPLPSNTIQEFAYNSTNGEVFMLTDKGLSSFRSNSSIGSPVHSNVKIFPNPIRPGYNGQVGFSGLAQNANLKIADINGKLIREVQANGSSASWDLLDYNQRRVASGVYVVFSTTFDGEESYVGKIAVIEE